MQRIRSTLASALLLALLPATASAFLGLGVRDDWQAVRAHEPMRPLHFVVPERDLPRICKTHPAAATYGCAVRDPASKVCLIYTAADPPQWLMEHELKHCDGYDHGPTHVAFMDSRAN